MNNAGFMSQIGIHFGICARNYKNEHRWSVLISAILMPLLIISVTGDEVFTGYGDTRKGAFAFICACIWIGLFNSIQNICKERQIVAHDYREGMNLFAYILAQMLFETIICFLESIIVTVIVMIRYAHNLSNPVLMIIGIWISFFLIIEGSDALGLLVSSIVRRPDQAMTIMPFVLIVQLVFAGCIFELNGIAKVIGYFTISKWGLDAIMTVSGVQSLSDWLQSMFNSSSNDAAPYFLCWIVMIAFTLIYLLLAGIFLHLVKFDKR